MSNLSPFTSVEASDIGIVLSNVDADQLVAVDPKPDRTR